MHRIAAIVVVLFVASAGQAVAQGPFDGWVWVSVDRQGCPDCSVKVRPGDPRAQQQAPSEDALAVIWLQADTLLGEAMPSWLRVGAALDEILTQMPDSPYRAESGNRQTYSWVFQPDRSRIVLTFEDSVLQTIDVRD